MLTMSVDRRKADIAVARAEIMLVAKNQKRSDLTGTNMEVIVSISETKPGETLPRHFHNGEEAFYTLDDTTIEQLQACSNWFVGTIVHLIT